MTKGQLIDLTGMRFGRLTVIETYKSSGRKYCKCKCDCGNEKAIIASNLTRGYTRSCGCFNREVAKERGKKHGFISKKDKRLYRIYWNIRTRCYNPNDIGYHRYGGRGIRMCDEWLSDFTAFRDWANANGYDDNLTIDRINNNGNYEPSNCRWASKREQATNRHNSIHVTYQNETHPLSVWADIAGVKYSTLYQRLKHGMTFEQAINR